MGEKVKLLELVSSLGYAGTQRAMLTFCRNINKNFFEAFVGAYDAGGPRENDIKEMGLKYVVANKDITALLRFIEENTIDIVHFHRSGHHIPFEYEIIKGIKNLNKNIIIIETNVFGKFDTLAFPLIDCSIEVSKMMMNERYVKLAGAFDPGRMLVLYSPVDVNTFLKNKPTEEEVLVYKNKNGIKKDEFVIGRLGRPDVSKWSDLLINMMPHLVKLVPNVKCILQAAPTSRIKRIKKSRWAKYFVFLEPSTDDKQIGLFYSALDVYTHSSKIGESFGLTMAEAALFDKPVVVNSTPNRDNNQLELVDHMQTGIIANEPQTFARALAYLYQNSEERERMGKKGHEKIVRECDGRLVTSMLEKICIEKMLEKSLPVEPLAAKHYRLVQHYPSTEDVIDYRVEYQKRLLNNFTKLTAVEKAVNLLNKPKDYFYKLSDFIENKF